MPISLIFRFLQRKSPVLIWLHDRKDVKLGGTISGFDEYMNIVLVNSFELNVRSLSRKPLGSILLKGENISLIHENK